MRALVNSDPALGGMHEPPFSHPHEADVRRITTETFDDNLGRLKANQIKRVRFSATARRNCGPGLHDECSVTLSVVTLCGASGLIEMKMAG